MEHAVFYQSTQGTPAFRRLASLEDAVSFAEHLRNVEGVTDFSVYALSPVTLSLRAYYHVEVAGTAAPDSSAVASAPAASASVPPATEPATEQDAPAPATAAAQDEAATAPSEAAYVPGMPFAAAPPVNLPTASAESAQSESGEPLPDRTSEHGAFESAAIDPSVVDPTVEEVVPGGRRSMGFFARS